MEVKRTLAEYRATAMLLDMTYDETIHAYVLVPDDPAVPCQHWDADSFAELDTDEVTFRGNNAFEKGVLSVWVNQD